MRCFRLRTVLTCLAALGCIVAPALAQGADPATQFAEALEKREAGDPVAALSLAEAAAIRGHTRSAVLAGDIWESGAAGVTDYDRAVEYFRMAAAREDADALLRLGMMARDGRGGLSPALAHSFLQRAADAGRPEARYELAKVFLDEQSPMFNQERGMSLMRLAASEGVLAAQRDLGLTLAVGEGEEDAGSPPAEAAQWLSLAADAGDADSAYAAGLVELERGNPEAAADLYLRAAEMGHAEAAADLGWLMYRGEVSLEGRGDVADWLRRAAIAGDPVGRFRFAWALAEGRNGVIEQDLESAYRWILLAEAAGVQERGAGGDSAKIKSWLESQLDPALIERIADTPLFVEGG